MLAGSIRGIEIYEYTPLEIKQAVVGYGRATKKQIKYMLKAILGTGEDLSICHDNNYKFRDKARRAGSR